MKADVWTKPQRNEQAASLASCGINVLSSAAMVEINGLMP